MRPTTTVRRPSWARSVWRVLTLPALWPTALRVVHRTARPGWWRRPPFLPVPDRAYWTFRSVTAFGGEGGAPDPDEVVAYLEWCRAWPSVVRR
ncbi:hypothetical protein [Actinomarinicola tropica]|uniref:Uncharacterized protein n=1 Tax=Actinomarinicola tropica TaxID=2789776 RepID=A0A5Q2RFE5_9ACTN|nr:hypothetical protein [Actinomarinicola tropica]QGG95558.1 hypothetical protein GH723_10880 [Actinomarinicola tropica]